jgi:hypothetical protein
MTGIRSESLPGIESESLTTFIGISTALRLLTLISFTCYSTSGQVRLGGAIADSLLAAQGALPRSGSSEAAHTNVGGTIQVEYFLYGSIRTRRLRKSRIKR